MSITLDRPVRTHRTAISHRDLTPIQQTGWNTVEELTYDLEQAAHAGANVAAELVLAHATAAQFLGIDLPAGDILVQCSCIDCPDACDRITAFKACAEYLDGNVQRPQCPACVKDHRHYGD
ncbi:hypothetical protein [Streptomyces sp. NPDC048516]|uniref:hypothetical protein n=1 Tax=Streptomyces sp. NPDC048516 TaxID=3365565 RepID=UPI00371677D7